jgi:hypothetical protein
VPERERSGVRRFSPGKLVATSGGPDPTKKSKTTTRVYAPELPPVTWMWYVLPNSEGHETLDPVPHPSLLCPVMDKRQ